MTARRSFARDEGGQAIVVMAILMLTLFLFVGVAIDLGVLFVARRAMQEAADAAAFGGAVVLNASGPASSAMTAATTDAQLNGYQNDSVTTVTAASPPTTGPHASDPLYVEVTITRQVQTPLLPAQNGFTSVSVRGVAGAARRTINYAFLVLNPTVHQAFTMANASTVTVNGGNVLVDSNALGDAAYKSGAGAFNVQAGYTAKAVGGQTGFSNLTTGATYYADPFSGYLRPSPSGLTTYSNTTISTTTTISPGIYSNGISVSGSATVTFNPGIYILQGGGLSVGGSAALTGTGVMIFNTLSNYPTETGTCGSVSLSGTGNLTLSGPTTGYYQGMLIYQDPTCAAALTISGNGTINSPGGTVYVPKGSVTIAGVGNMTISGQVVADRISIGNNGTLTVTYTSATSAQPLLPSLAE